MSPNTRTPFEALRAALLGAEKTARDLIGEYENRYAKAHLQEVSAFMRLALAQIEYADLAANNPPDRTDNNPVDSLTEVWTEITAYGDAERIFISDDGRMRTEPFGLDDAFPEPSEVQRNEISEEEDEFLAFLAANLPEADCHE